jgi:predicted metal-dependent hydrolase
MAALITLGDIAVDVVFKDIKNIHLSVYPPDGKVRIAAPTRMNLDTLRVFAISKLVWIRRQQQKLREQARETPRECLERESHFLWGNRYLLKVVEQETAQTLVLEPRTLVLTVRPGTREETRNSLVAAWYRQQIRMATATLLAKWEPLLGVKAKRIFVQRMKTRWGSCNPHSGSIRLNTELAKKPPECLEYVVVHELTHLLERQHNERFTGLMDTHLPHWRQVRTLLNAEPLGQASWSD